MEHSGTNIASILQARQSKIGCVIDAKTKAVLGYELGGCLAGPVLLVVGYGATLRAVRAKFATVPTLPWIRGRVVVLPMELLEPSGRGPSAPDILDQPYDDMIMLAYQGADLDSSVVAQDGYQTILRKCRDMGMISGRGIARQ